LIHRRFVAVISVNHAVPGAVSGTALRNVILY
jgi:hypothetical protein